MNETILLLVMAANFLVLHVVLIKYLKRVERHAKAEGTTGAKEYAIKILYREAVMYKYFAIFFLLLLLVCIPSFSFDAFYFDSKYLVNMSKFIAFSVIAIMVRFRFLKFKLPIN